MLPGSAFGHLVTGRVRVGKSGRCEQESLFVFHADSVSVVRAVRTDSESKFACVLPAGHYRIEFKDERGRRWTADFDAEEDPVDCDIHLRKAKTPKAP